MSKTAPLNSQPQACKLHLGLAVNFDDTLAKQMLHVLNSPISRETEADHALYFCM